MSDYGEVGWSEEEFEEVKKELDKKGFEIERIYPLTAMQEGMLFHEITDSGLSKYTVQTAYLLNNELDLNAFEKSLQLLSKRLEALRTSFMYTKVSEPCQILLKDKKIECSFMDFTYEDEETRKELIEEVLESDLNQKFNLEDGNTFRVKVIKLEHDKSVLIISFHHIIMDGWCMSLLLKEMQACYTDILKTSTETHVIVQKGLFEKYVYDRRDKDQLSAKKYWERLLDGYDTDTQIRGEKSSTYGKEKIETVSVAISDNLSQNLVEISKKLGVTVNTVLETAWALLLQGYSVSDDVVFGKVVSGRNTKLSNINNLVGLCINTIPVRVKSELAMSVEELLVYVQNQALDSEKYDYYPLAEIQQMCNNSNLISSIIAFENYYVPLKDNSLWNLQQVYVREGTNYNLTICAYLKEQLNIEIIYNASVYVRREVRQLLHRLIEIMNYIVLNPKAPINTVPLIAKSEESRLLSDFNKTYRDYPIDKTIISLFEEQVSINPSKVAVESEENSISYEDLNARANVLANVMKKSGIVAGDIVAILAERKLETIISMVAILKVGAIYLPIDANNPEDRIQLLLDDSDCKMLLIMSEQGNKIWGHRDNFVVDTRNIVLTDVEFTSYKGNATDAAYIMYTSGTTGIPKGVCVSNQNVVSLVRNIDYVNLENSRIMQSGALAFDATTFEVWGALLNGGYIFIASQNVLANTDLFRETIGKKNITTMFLTTALFNSLVNIDLHVFDGLKELLVGGETANAKFFNILNEENKDVMLSNVYGPTETTTFATAYKLEKSRKYKEIPIGRPISNMTAYIMNGNRLCGIGMPGELCIGGYGVALGYRARKELNAEKFIDNPYIVGERLYKTGDIARWLPDGNIEFLGRRDNQVKIRGFRIELEEIEKVITELEGIREAVVVALKEEEKCLSAYIVAEDFIDENFIRESLAKKIPYYMIPKYFTFLSTLPITKNGKVDKKKLPKPEISSCTNYVAPRNAVEEKVAEIFRNILNLQRISVYDNFFKIGGHSLKAVRLINMVDKLFGVRITLGELHKLKTVFEIAKLIKQEKPQLKYDSFDKSIEKRESMTPAQKRIYSIEMSQNESISYNIPVIYRLTEDLNSTAFENALLSLIKRHEVLRTKFNFENGHFIQEICDVTQFQVEKEEIQEVDIKNYIYRFVQPFDLGKAPLMRVKVVHTDSGNT
ncbi:amino acid adenylation domain-containing protein, partial [Mediterraneibacter gnavus]|uniref:amino acid adenylation domain-containing protein n=1 Tax=Mediterraneibacter gnavus TaxID=33038 RepID=UPI00321B379B